VFDPAFGRAQHAWAVDVVSRVCRASFDPVPRVRYLRPDAYLEATAQYLKRDPDRAGTDLVALRERCRRNDVELEFGRCEQDHDVVSIQPDGLSACAHGAWIWSRPESIEVLGLVLVHELAHALDFQRFANLDPFGPAWSGPGSDAVELVVEGHAHYVTEQVAQRCGLEDAFVRLQALVYGADDPSRLYESERELARRRANVYAQGRRLFEIAYEIGRLPLVEDLLRHPPRRVGDEHEQWRMLWKRLAKLQEEG
jgi:hypothetical protein